MSDLSGSQSAGMGWVRVLDLNATPLEGACAVEVGVEELVILRHADRYVALDRWCPHEHGDLAQGRVLGRALKCPLHGFMFNVETGRGLNCRGFDVRVHEVKVENGVLSVRLAP